jgi:glycosyltransferase involved in cell wall biosynthesis
MKLLMLTDGIAPLVIGGMQKHSYELTKNLAVAGHQITLVHCVYDKSAIPDKQRLTEAFGEAASANIEFISMRFPAPAWYPGHYVKESYIYSKWIYDKVKNKLQDFDFIYAKGFTGWYFLDKKNKGQQMPPVGVKFHGYEMLQAPGNWKMRLHNMILRSPTIWNNRHADCVFSYGGKITEIIASLGVPRKRIIEVPTGIDENWIRASVGRSEPDILRFIFIGRFERRKGIEEINQVLKTLPSDNKWEFHFVGPVPPSAKLRIPQAVYHGQVSDMKEIQKLLDKCQVLVAPSHAEGMPNVIMEAMARGLAILTTDVGAIASVVSEENGWFVQPGDEKTLRAALLTVLGESADKLLIRQKTSLQRIRQYSWEKIASDTALLIGQFCK